MGQRYRLFARSSKKLWLRALQMRASVSVSIYWRLIILQTLAGEQLSARASHACERCWRFSSCSISFPTCMVFAMSRPAPNGRRIKKWGNCAGIDTKKCGSPCCPSHNSRLSHCPFPSNEQRRSPHRYVDTQPIAHVFTHAQQAGKVYNTPIGRHRCIVLDEKLEVATFRIVKPKR